MTRSQPQVKEISACYAIVPAAGSSRRMGQSKLLLPWPVRTKAGLERSASTCVIDSVLSAYVQSELDAIVVVCLRNDEELLERCRQWPVRVLVVDDQPEDMKASVLLAVDYLQREFAPRPADRCFIAPADIPALQADLCRTLIETVNNQRDASAIAVPTSGTETGHPALMPWRLVLAARELPPNRGMNVIVNREPRISVAVPEEWMVKDIDTIDEYAVELERFRLNTQNATQGES